MASSHAGSSLDAGAPHVGGGAPLNASGAPVDTTQLDKFVEKAHKAALSGRHALASAIYRRAAEEALRLHGETFVCTYLTLERATSLSLQSQLESVTVDEKETLREESWALASCCLPLILRRMDANTMLPGRGTAVELAFFKRFTVIRDTACGEPPLSSRHLQLVGLSLGYATTLRAATQLLTLLCVRRDFEGVQAFVLRVVDCMLPATRSLTGVTLREELAFADMIQSALSGAFPYDATFVASLRSKWSSADVMEMRRKRGLLDVSQKVDKTVKEHTERLRKDIAKHGLMDCALPSCGKREASVGQHKRCSACRSVSYCSEEHGALHWKEHKSTCRAATAAMKAATEGGAGAA